jgi:hypothetical protein
LPLGDKGGAGNLVICEVVRVHVDPSILDENQRIDQQRSTLWVEWVEPFIHVRQEKLFTLLFNLIMHLPSDLTGYLMPSNKAIFYPPMTLLHLHLEELPTDGDIAQFMTRNDIQRIISQPDASNLLQNYAHQALIENLKRSFHHNDFVQTNP